MELFKNMKFLSEVYLRNNLCVNQDFITDSAIDSISEQLKITCEFDSRVKSTFEGLSYPILMHPVNAVLILLASVIIFVTELYSFLKYAVYSYHIFIFFRFRFYGVMR